MVRVTALSSPFLLGFDDIELAAYTSPPLTTVAQPKEAIGTGAAGLLLERLRDGRSEPRRAILQPELHKRASTARPLGLDRYWRNARVHTLHDPVDLKLRDIGRHLLDGVPPTPTPYS